MSLRIVGSRRQLEEEARQHPWVKRWLTLFLEEQDQQKRQEYLIKLLSALLKRRVIVTDALVKELMRGSDVMA